MAYGGNANFWGFGRGFDRNCRFDGERGFDGGYGFEGRRGDSIPAFLTTLSPGVQVELQYDHQRPACGTFQGFERGNVILTDYDGFPGLVRIAPNRINAVAPFVHRGHR